MPLRRVLIVDDEPYILRILAFKLRRAGYDALEATCSEQAIEALCANRVHCIILDVTLASPTTGFRFAEELRDDPRFCRIPVIFLTAHGLPADRRRGEALGAAAYITKPFALNDVLEAVARLVPA
jgi:CheY-like chemotaxis protein